MLTGKAYTHTHTHMHADIHTDIQRKEEREREAEEGAEGARLSHKHTNIQSKDLITKLADFCATLSILAQ
jgi:hypothetical protein